MRKTIITASLLVLLTLGLTQLAISQAQWKDNVFTNQTSGDLFVAFTTYRPATGTVPLGWRTVAWYEISPGGSHTFQAFGENAIYYLIYAANTNNFLKPENAKSFRGWEYVEPFVIVSEDEPDTFTPAADLLFTTYARTSNLLVENSNYFKSANTGSVTVTPTGVNAPLAELELVARPPSTEEGTEARPTGGQTSGATGGQTQTPGAWSISGISSGPLASGQSITVSVTVTSADGTNMEGATVTFSENSDFLEFNPTSATTNSSGVASSTLSSKGEKSEAQTVSVSVSGSSEGAKSYSITVPHDTVSMQDSYRVTSRKAGGLFCLTQAWYDWATSSSPQYITFDYPILTYSTPVEQVSSVDRPFITLSGHRKADSNRVAIWGRVREHCIDQNVMTVVVNAMGKYVAADFGVEAPSSSGAPPLQPQLRPELEQLSAVWHDLSEIPTETALLPNYPNPFNPETWIPYHLAEPADVTLRIYAADGKQVRTLALGHQSAGIYENKSRAAYWDGRNTTGERVASGLYFYTLTAGDFAATKKMLIMK